jgi:3',5'-cyclic AMP phosphodiesterase CpdA
MPELRLAHVSDLHIPSRWPRAPWLYLGKRLIGALNYKLKRGREHPLAAVVALVREIAEDASIDHAVVTGDVTNVAFPEEFAAARELLRPLIERGPGFLSVIPGNHDRYTYVSERRRYFEEHFHDCITSELDTGAPFPFVRFRKEVAIVGLDSGVASLPLLATGRLGDEQRARLAATLERPELKAARFRVALIHHPPLVAGGRRDQLRHRLLDDREVLALAARGGIDLLLHGHIHVPFEVEHEDTGCRLRGIGAGSSTRLHGSPAKVGGVNVYTIRDGRLAAVETRTFDPATGRYSGRRP